MNISVNQTKTDEFSQRIHQKTRKGVTSANAGLISKNLGAHVDGPETTFLVWHPKIKDAENSKVISTNFFILIDL